MRRSISLSLALGGLLLATMVAPPGVGAQDESMSMADHPAVGAWIINPTETDPPELFTASADGVVVDAGPQSTGYGSWTPSGEHSADLTFLSPMVDPDAGFLGFVTIRASADFSADGQSFTGTWTAEFPAAVVEAMGLPEGELGPGDVSGQRIAVEAMGEPAGPMPEMTEEAPAE